MAETSPIESEADWPHVHSSRRRLGHLMKYSASSGGLSKLFAARNVVMALRSAPSASLRELRPLVSATARNSCINVTPTECWCRAAAETMYVGLL